jgi:hypothetical protein
MACMTCQLSIWILATPISGRWAALPARGSVQDSDSAAAGPRCCRRRRRCHRDCGHSEGRLGQIRTAWPLGTGPRLGPLAPGPGQPDDDARGLCPRHGHGGALMGARVRARGGLGGWAACEWR